MTETEKKSWAALEATYGQCVELAGRVWNVQLDAATEAQRNLAETMRDRLLGPDATEPLFEAGAAAINIEDMQVPIPVPLFTPRDRLQFLKEVSVTLLIEASKRGLSVTPDDAPPEPARVPFGKTKGTLLTEVAPDELESMLTWIAERPDRTQKYGVNAMEMEAELQTRREKAQAIQTQPLDEVPIALQESGTP